MGLSLSPFYKSLSTSFLSLEFIREDENEVLSSESKCALLSLKLRINIHAFIVYILFATT